MFIAVSKKELTGTAFQPIVISMIAEAPTKRPQGRPATGHVRLVVHVQPTTNRAIRAKAKTSGQSISAVVEQAIVDSQPQQA